MKTLAALALTGLAVTVLLQAPAPAQDPATLVQRVTALEAEVDALKKQLADAPTKDEAAEFSVARMQETLDATIVYLTARSVADKKLLAELDRVEALGFTAGINGSSREALLAGMRAQLNTSSSGLPAVRKKEAESDSTKR